MLQDIAAEVEQHLARNRDAVDSAEGIRAWWLSPRLRAAPLELVIGALERLQREGVVERRPVGAGYLYAAVRRGDPH